MKRHVFLSYSRADGETLGVIEELLKRGGIRCWVDRRGLHLGEHFDHEIEDAIRRSAAVVWLVSSKSIQSDYVRFELTTALHHGRPILPVRLEPISLSELPSPLNQKLGTVQSWDYFLVPADQLGTEPVEGLKRLVRRELGRVLLRLGAVGMAAALVVALIASKLAGTGAATTAPPTVSAAVVPLARPIRPSLARLPFAEVMKVVYGENPPAPDPGAPRVAIELQIEARRAGEKAPRRLKDGDSLASKVDDYRIVAKALSPGYLYVFQVDAAGKVNWIFPRNLTTSISAGSNPVKDGQASAIPAGQWLYLDSTVGVEHLYAVFSATRWQRLEEALGQLPTVVEESQAVVVVVRGAIDEPNKLGFRGIGGVRPDAPTGAGAGATLESQGDRFQSDGSFLVIERWFRHVP